MGRFKMGKHILERPKIKFGEQFWKGRSLGTSLRKLVENRAEAVSIEYERLEKSCKVISLKWVTKERAFNRENGRKPSRKHNKNNER